MQDDVLLSAPGGCLVSICAPPNMPGDVFCQIAAMQRENFKQICAATGSLLALFSIVV